MSIVFISDARTPICFLLYQTDTATPQIKARVTGRPTMGGIDGLNKDASVWWCATRLSSQVGRDNGTRAACPCKTCDVAEDIRGCTLTTTQHTPVPRPTATMRCLVPLCAFLAAAALHSGKKNTLLWMDFLRFRIWRRFKMGSYPLMETGRLRSIKTRPSF